MTSIGAMIMSVFATIWWIVGAKASHYSPLVVFVVPFVITLAIGIVAWRRSRSSGLIAKPNRRVIAIASTLEGVSIWIAVNVLNNTGHPDWMAPIIAIIVGLHFFPIAKWLPASLYYVTGALLITLGVIGLVLPSGPTNTIVVTWGAACILWLTSVAVLRRVSAAAAAAV